jgi:cytochrome c peroxidase
LALFSCEDDAIIIPITFEGDFSNIYNLPETPFNYSNIVFPETFNNSTVQLIENTPNDNPITNDGATLGRVLFYDKNLSINNTIACASCHVQEFGFADPNPTSLGFEGGHTRRNSMNIVNTGFYEPNLFFWDHRANSLEEQVLIPFQDSIEMGMTSEELLNRVSTFDYYKPLFQKAFNNSEVTLDKISKAMAQFVRSIYSFNTKYDAGIEITNNIFEDFPNFTAQENIGKDIFNGKLTPETNGTCAFCHIFNFENLIYTAIPSEDANQVIFSGTRTDNIGLDEDWAEEGVDNGLGEITNIESDNGQFKVPSLRNIAITAPYMHDGRFETLEEVVDHYSNGIKDHQYLSDHMISGASGEPRNLMLTPEEEAALVAFLKTLTDQVMINDEKYSNPFIEN